MALIDNCVSYYSFNSDASDSVGSNDGTLVNSPTSVSGKTNLGNGYYLDGVDQEITIPEIAANTFGTGDWSINFWFKVPVGKELMLSKQQGATPYTGWNLDIHPTGVFTRYNSGSGVKSQDSDYTDNTWHMYTITRSGSTLTTYIDASGSSPSIDSSSAADYSTAINLGKLPWGAVWYEYSIQAFGIWKGEALSQTLINELWAGSDGLAYPFSEPPVQVTKDGDARIQVEQSETKTGTARIQIDDTEEVYDCEARIQLTNQQTKTGTARIQIQQSKTTDGNASIILQSEILKTGNASIDFLVEQVTKDGDARIQVEQSQNKTGDARISLDDNEVTKTGTARIELQDNQISKTGDASITFVTEVKVTKTGTAFISIPDDFKPIFNSIQNKIPKINSSQNMSPIIKSVEFSNLKSVKQSDKTGSAFIVFP